MACVHQADRLVGYHALHDSHHLSIYHQAGLEGLRLLVREQAATIEALRVEQAAQREADRHEFYQQLQDVRQCSGCMSPSPPPPSPSPPPPSPSPSPPSTSPPPPSTETIILTLTTSVEA